MSTLIYFVRHGESESNSITQFAGSLDMPLTAKGREQARLTAEYLKEVHFSMVYASDLCRAYDTGMAIAQMQRAPILGDSALREIYAGQWEGKTYAELETLFPDSYGVWRSKIGFAQCPDGESVKQLQQRVAAFIDDVVRLHPNETICIATHATPIRVMECIWTDTGLEAMHTLPWVSNASITVVEYDEQGRGRLLEKDIHRHLGDLHTVLAKNV